MTEYPPRGCSYLDARLSFRRANSTGYLEICSEEGQWGLACTNDVGISRDTAIVICRQLGFNSSVVRSFRISVTELPMSGESQFTFALTSGSFSCRGNETNLMTCQQSDVLGGRKRRGIDIRPSVCRTFTEIQCGGEQAHSYNQNVLSFTFCDLHQSPSVTSCDI